MIILYNYMSNHFITSYFGNKRQEYKEIKNIIKLDNINTIIEPFCGSSAISYNIWKDNPDKNIKYVLNDNNQHLMELYKIMKNDNIEDFIKKINDIKDTIKNKEDYNAYVKTDNKTVYEYFIASKFYNIRPALYDKDMHKNKFKLTKEQYRFIEFVKSPNVEIIFGNWFDLYDKYKNDETAYIIFDPPYLQLCNDFYLNKSVNVYEYFFNNKITDYKSKILFVLEDIWIIRLLFNGCNTYTYDKQYQTTKKKTKHLCITNY